MIPCQSTSNVLCISDRCLPELLRKLVCFCIFKLSSQTVKQLSTITPFSSSFRNYSSNDNMSEEGHVDMDTFRVVLVVPGVPHGKRLSCTVIQSFFPVLFFTSLLFYIASSSTQGRGAPGPFSSVSAAPHTSPSNDKVTFHPSSSYSMKLCFAVINGADRESISFPCLQGVRGLLSPGGLLSASVLRLIY